MKLTEMQVDNIKHALGLSRKKIPYRNYYNDNDNASWNELVVKGIAKKIEVKNCSGAFMYCLNDSGIRVIQGSPDLFNLDKRLLKMDAMKLIKKYEL